MKKCLFFYLLLAVIISSCGKDVVVTTQPVTNPPGETNPPGQTNPSTSATIVILGSSTAAGVGATPSDSAWVNRVRLATLSNKKSLYFINLALTGYSSYQGMPDGYSVANRPAVDTARNITKALTYKPSLVIITYPTNDVASNYTDEEIMNNFKTMVSLLDSAKVQYIIFGTQPRNFTELTQRERLKTLNDKIKSAYSGHFIDNFGVFAAEDLTIKPELSFGDGIHFNNAGHYIIVQLVLANTLFQNIIK